MLVNKKIGVCVKIAAAGIWTKKEHFSIILLYCEMLKKGNLFFTIFIILNP